MWHSLLYAIFEMKFKYLNLLFIYLFNSLILCSAHCHCYTRVKYYNKINKHVCRICTRIHALLLTHKWHVPIYVLRTAFIFFLYMRIPLSRYYAHICISCELYNIACICKSAILLWHYSGTFVIQIVVIWK